MAQQAPNRRQQILEIERLHQHLVGPGLEGRSEVRLCRDRARLIAERPEVSPAGDGDDPRGDALSRIALMSSMPWTFGMMMSVMTTSAGDCANVATASTPLVITVTW
ncbi:MAG TPA: hypothetical protein VEV18_03775 [Steroidobacteraceae bacterium]|nr:hypothetical protein [Steroidobacteraceae bacterium]